MHNAKTIEASPPVAVGMPEQNSWHISRQLSLNSLSGAVRFAILTGIYFLTYPYMLHSLGPERFGLWALGLAVSQWIAAGDLGIAGSLMKFVPEHWNTRNIPRISQLATAGLLVIAPLGAILVALVWAFRHDLLGLLSIPRQYRGDMMWLILGMPIIFLINLLASFISSIISGIQRMDISNFIYSATMGVSGVGIFFVLSRGYGLVGLMANAALAAILWVVLLICAVRWLVPGLRIAPKLVQRSDVQELLHFGAYLQVAMFAGALAIPTVRVLLSRYVSLASVSYFELASGMAMQARSFFIIVTLPLVPATSHLASMQGHEKLSRLYRFSVRFLLFSALPAALLIIVLAPSFIRIWLGSGVPYVASTFSLLGLAWMINAPAIPAYFMSQGLGYPKYQMYCQCLVLLATATLGYFLVRTFGYYGAVMGLVLGIFVATVFIMERCHRLLNIRFREMWDISFLKVILVNVSLYLAVVYLLHGRTIGGLPELIFISVGYIAVYVMLIISFRSIRGSDSEIGRAMLPPFFSKFLFGRDATPD